MKRKKINYSSVDNTILKKSNIKDEEIYVCPVDGKILYPHSTSHGMKNTIIVRKYYCKRCEKWYRVTEDIIETPKTPKTKYEKEIVLDKSDFLIKSNDIQCFSRNHKVDDIIAIIRVFNMRRELDCEVPARFCQDCGVYYISEYYYERLKRRGFICCNVQNIYNFQIRRNNSDFGFLNDQSILNKCGYNVNSQDDLSDQERQNILSFVINNGIQTKQQVVNFLIWIIDFKNNCSDAVYKYERDLDFVEKYQKPDIKVRAERIIRKVKLYE